AEHGDRPCVSALFFHREAVERELQEGAVALLRGHAAPERAFERLLRLRPFELVPRDHTVHEELRELASIAPEVEVEPARHRRAGLGLQYVLELDLQAAVLELLEQLIAEKLHQARVAPGPLGDPRGQRLWIRVADADPMHWLPRELARGL